MAQIPQLGFLTWTLLIETRLGIRGRGMSSVAPFLAPEIHRGIARIVGGWGRGTLGLSLGLETFETGPCLDQSPIHRKVLARQQMLSARLRQHLGKEGLGNLARQQSVAILAKRARIPHC